MSDETLKLESVPPHFLTAAQLGRRWGLSAVTIRNYRNAGMPVAGKNHLDIETFDLPACEEWREKFRPPHGHGGRRRGAGRSGEGGGAAGRQGEGERGEGRGGDASLPLIAEAQKAALRLKTENLRLGSAQEILDSWSKGGDGVENEINTALVKNAYEILRAATERLEYDKAAGKLVDRDDIARTLGEHLAIVRMSIDGLPARMVQAVMGELGLAVELTEKLRAVLEAQVRSVCAMLAENPLSPQSTQSGTEKKEAA